ncbi:MAG TPA: hypothetical protein VNZ26_10275, partial [Vicinamibacterales bacterium]|nr:hypothetical protein [Vicinamibacterales bacterium]
IMTLTQAYHRFMEPPSLLEPRAIEVLSYLATLHLALAAFNPRRWTWLRVVAALGQVVLLVAAYQARSVLAWQMAFVLVASGSSAIWWRSKSSRAWVVALVPAAFLVTGFVSLKAYEHASYNPRYFQDMGARTIWHNALMGLSANEYLRSTYGLDVDDARVIDAVAAYMQRTHDPRLTAQWSSSTLLSALGNHGTFNWFEYEAAARDFYFYIWRTDWRSAMRCYLLDKPKAIAALTWRVSRDSTRTPGLTRAFGTSQLSLGAIIIITPALIFLFVRKVTLLPTVWSLPLLMAFSALPSYLSYAVVPTMMGFFVTVSLVAYSIVALSLVALRTASGFRSVT